MLLENKNYFTIPKLHQKISSRGHDQVISHMTNLKVLNSSCREGVLSIKLQIQSPTYILPIFVPLVIEADVAPLETP